MSQHLALLLGALLQVWYLGASFVTWYTIDRIGRRKLFISMAIGMSLVLIAEAICVRINNTPAAIAAVVFVFAFEACFTWGWMATVWLYPPEILPLKTRAQGAALAAAADFLGNFIVVEITPPALQNIGYKTYVIFAVLNVVNAAVVWAVYPETAGLTLEGVDFLFQGGGEVGREEVGGRGLQWDVVGRAEEVRRRLRIKEGARDGEEAA